MLNTKPKKAGRYPPRTFFPGEANSQPVSARLYEEAESVGRSAYRSERMISTEELAMVCGRTLQALRDVRHMLSAEGIEIVDAALNDAI